MHLFAAGRRPRNKVQQNAERHGKGKIKLSFIATEKSVKIIL
jgi:hypothetical protein